MADALIGHSGFVGGTLLSQRPFDALYRSTNIAELAGRTFDLVVCAGAPAEKWKANKLPDADKASIKTLTDALEGVTAREVVLISTIDVYPVPVGVDERSPIDPEAGQPYGRHRLELERFVQERFDTRVVRLPGLFGKGLKKNIIFDLLHGNQVDKLNPDSEFQFYDMSQLWDDIETARASGLGLVNFATEPVAVRDVAHEGFGVDLPARPGEQPARYNARSLHAAMFHGNNGYLRSSEQVLSALVRYVRGERGTP